MHYTLADYRYRHFTETAEEVTQYLMDKFQVENVSVRDFGADLQAGNASVEVKSCHRWVKSKCSNGNRRSGRFIFNGYEKADYYLFVLLNPNGVYMMRLLSHAELVTIKMKNKYGVCFSIPPLVVFGSDVDGTVTRVVPGDR